MKEQKTTHHLYAAWNFDKEIADLNRESQSGWQLVQGGCFHSKFRYDNSVIYRYALDYNTRIADMPLYRETFREQGWEYISSTFNGWHYFRKAYDPSLPTTEYAIYTDAASDGEMKRRWRRLAYTFGSVLAILLLVYLVLAIREPHIAIFCCCASFLTGSIAFFTGGRRIQQATQAGAPHKRRGATVVFLMLLCMLAGVVFSANRSYFNTFTTYDASAGQAPWVIATDVKLPDFYRLTIAANADSTVDISIVNEAGDIVASASGSSIHETLHMFLPRGSYRIVTAYRANVMEGSKGTFTYYWG